MFARIHLMKKIVCKVDYLKLHATSEMIDSGNPGVLSQALRDRLRYLVLYLRPFFLSSESVQEATEPVAKGKRGSPRGNRASRQRQARQPMHNTVFASRVSIVLLNRSAVWLAFCILIHFDFSVRLHLPQEVISTVLSTLVAVAVKSFRLWDHGPRNHEQVRRKYSGI